MACHALQLGKFHDCVSFAKRAGSTRIRAANPTIDNGMVDLPPFAVYEVTDLVPPPLDAADPALRPCHCVVNCACAHVHGQQRGTAMKDVICSEARHASAGCARKADQCAMTWLFGNTLRRFICQGASPMYGKPIDVTKAVGAMNHLTIARPFAMLGARSCNSTGCASCQFTHPRTHCWGRRSRRARAARV